MLEPTSSWQRERSASTTETGAVRYRVDGAALVGGFMEHE